MRPTRLLALLCLAVPLAPREAVGQIDRSVPPPGAETHTAPITERYLTSGLARWFLGAGYRDVWAAPIEIPVLDLGFAGGLTPVETGGYGQTTTLEFVGADRLEYAVRSIDKDPTRRLDSLFTGTVVARIVQDQVGQFLPTAGLVVDPLLEATGILHPEHRLVVIPDDPRLGEFREDFAGLIGILTERPQEGPEGTPGFAGSTRIVGTDGFLDTLEEGGCDRVDAREYLKARLMDMVMGDRDRHPGQWRWARYPDGDDCYLWRTIPEDRDQAFIMNDGLMLSVFRLIRPRQVRFGPTYPSLLGLTFNGWELDRQLLAELTEDEWGEVAEEIQRELTDAVIEDAVRRLPAPHYELRGPFLETSLKARRDALRSEALDFYRLISWEVDVKATDRAEHAVLEHLSDGGLRVAISHREGPRSGAPFFERAFERGVTREVRLYLQGGDDFVEILGGSGPIKVRVIGGGGDDHLVNRSETGAGNTRFYDDRGENRLEGRGRFDERSWERPPSTNLVHRYGLDWGRAQRYIPQLGYSPDFGLTLGVEAGFQRYGFRKAPWQSDNAITAGLATIGPEAFLAWEGRFRSVIWGGDLTFDAEYTTFPLLRFYGFGNETRETGEPDFFKVSQRALTAAPSLEWTWGQLRGNEQELDLRGFRPSTRISIGPLLEYTETAEDDNADRFLGMLDPAPLGVGNFGQIGARARLSVDTRNTPAYPTSGFHLIAGASAFPAIWDLEEAFGEVQGELSVFLTPGGGRRTPTLALRGGGKHVFGTFPFHRAAFLGGAADVRGLREERFAGQSATFANVELRIPLTRFFLLFPADFGLLAAADVGRVFFDGDPSDADTWHTGVGGGIWFAVLNRNQTLSFTLIDGEDITGLYVKAGLHF